MTANFVHLNLHTEYSIYDGLVRVPQLISRVKALGMPAVAITDRSNFFAAIKFYRSAVAMGVKPILGADLWVIDDVFESSKSPQRLIFLCQNKTGYHRLSELITESYRGRSQEGEPCLPLSCLNHDNTEGLLALSGGQYGLLAPALLMPNQPQLQSMADFFQHLFPERFYIELHRVGYAQEMEYLNAAIDFAHRESLPVVASNMVRFMSESDFNAHEARVCIDQGRVLQDPARPRCYTEKQYLRTPEEMAQLFNAIPAALTNTVEIMKRCTVELIFGQTHLPKFNAPNNAPISTYFSQQVHVRYQHFLDERTQRGQALAPQQVTVYRERLEEEIEIIDKMGFPSYFLIVADFIQWAKDNQVPVGPGRGSGAGSLVAYVLGITDIDPMKYDLLFERFLNPERVSLPDFDIDFCMWGRDRVIEYVTEKYGRDRVSQIITYGTMAAKAVVRDTGRVLGYPYGMVDKLAKLIPFELGMTIDRALEQEALLLQQYQEENDVKILIDLAKKLEGCTRNVGKHAGGVVIAPQPLVAYTPLYCEAGADAWVSQFDKDDIETIGLIKFDFLGLRTLTIIDLAVKMVNAKGQTPIDIRHIALDDRQSFILLKACDTTAVFQLESRGMKELIKRLQPDCFDDIVALVALFRPGPLQSGMVDEYIDRKHGRAEVVYMHPVLEPILQPTYGVILYQEQVMQIAQVLSGLSLGQADLLRRAMGKKKAEEMAKQRSVFIEGAQNNDVDPQLAGQIFDLIEKFAGYGFNKSHSVAYALLAYQTAWLKSHYPAEFMAAVLTADMDNTDKVVVLVAACRAMKRSLSSPCINRSNYRFAVDGGQIIYGLGAVKGVGQSVAEAIVSERQAQGPYRHLADFCLRLAAAKLSRRVLDILCRSGALDCLEVERACLVASIEKALLYTQQQQRDQSLGQTDMFSLTSTDTGLGPSDFEYVTVPAWRDRERLAGEKAVLGFYLSGHPMGAYSAELKQLGIVTLSQLELKPGNTLLLSGMVVAVRKILTKQGKRIAYVTLEDEGGTVDVAVFHEMLQQYQMILEVGKLLVVKGETVFDEFRQTVKLTCQGIRTLDQLRRQRAPKVVLRLQGAKLEAVCLSRLQTVLAAHQGGTSRVVMDYVHALARVQLVLGVKWQVAVTEDLLDQLREMEFVEDVCLNY